MLIWTWFEIDAHISQTSLKIKMEMEHDVVQCWNPFSPEYTWSQYHYTLVLDVSNSKKAFKTTMTSDAYMPPKSVEIFKLYMKGLHGWFLGLR